MTDRMILICTFMAVLLCFGKKKHSLRFSRLLLATFYFEEMLFKAHKMVPTSVNATLTILTQPKSSSGIDPSQSNYVSSKMSFHVYGKSDFVNPENIVAFFQQIRTHPRTVILLRSRGKKNSLKASLARTKSCAKMIAILIQTA